MDKQKPKAIPPEESREKNLRNRRVVRGEDNSLSNFYKELDGASKRQKEEQDKFFAELGEPALFIPDRDREVGDKKSGLGYWLLPWGVLTMERTASGRWRYYTQIRYTRDEIETLYSILHQGDDS